MLNAINISAMIYSGQRIEGFVCHKWLSGAQGHFYRDMKQWLEEGKLKAEETLYTGIEAWPEAFGSLFSGAHTGKAVLLL